ncbi:MAG: amidohydrolase [Pseudomonadales bacterium]|jgi:predicted amidohydrolase YtcJ|nr:amidohydrolase [Pseudomonadales bacterium]
MSISRPALWLVALLIAVDAHAAPELILVADVVTVHDDRPRAEAVAVEAGLITAVGGEREVMALADDATRIERLDGTLVPGFFDAHGHLWLTGLQALFADLMPPPDGGVRSIAELQQGLRVWAAEEQVDLDGGWIVGMGYDDAQLLQRRHPTREELDAVSTQRPVFAVHQSWHLGAVNSVALARLGIDADTPDPEGGHIRRDADGEPTGVLEETAFTGALLPVLAGLDAAAAGELVRRGIEAYVANGFTTAQEGAAGAPMLAALGGAAALAPLPIDVTAYATIAHLEAHPELFPRDRAYDNGLRIAGTKLLLDGSPQGRTAWLTSPYHRPPGGRGPDYRGYPINRDEEVRAWVDRAFAEGCQVIAHANGDAAADQLIDAVRAARARHGAGDRRTIVIHAQTLRDDQLDAMAELDMYPSYFSAHTFYWGDWHRDVVLGPRRADRISPTRSALDRGLWFTIHHDAPIIDPNPLRLIHATVNRRTRSGDILGPEQRVDALTALKATTLWAARQAFEEDEKGSIEVGKRADLALLSGDPLAVDPEAIIGLRVLGTMKDGRWVYTE